MQRSPRFLRPHAIVIKHIIGEGEKLEAIFEETLLHYVKFEENYRMIQNQKGIASADDALCIIDLNDLCAVKCNKQCQYINYTKYLNQEGYFSIFKDDLIIFDGRKYTVNSIHEINPVGNNPIFIEVRANAS